MVTTHEPPFALADRVRGMDSLVVVTLGDRINTTVSESEPLRVRDEMDNDAERTVRQVFSTYEAQIEQVLTGALHDEVYEQQRLLLRVVGGKTNGAETKPTVELEEGETYAVFLAADVGSKRDERTFVPYFDGAYHVDDRVVDLPAELREELDADEPTLDNLADFAEREVADMRAWDDDLAEQEPDEERERPYPDVKERPAADTEGAQPVDTEPDEREENRE
jgi:hypothetical protein